MKSEPGGRVEAIAETLLERVNADSAEELVRDSIKTSREFCRTMIGISSGAIGAYIGVVAFLLGKDANVSGSGELFVILPAIVFLISAGVAAWGFLPRGATVSLNDPDGVADEMADLRRRRLLLARGSFMAFAVGVMLGATSILYAAQLESSGGPDEPESVPSTVAEVDE